MAPVNQSQNPFYWLAESAPYAIFIAVDGRIAYVNPAALQLFGATSPQQLVGTAVMDRIHPDDRDAVAQRIRKLYDEECALVPDEKRYLRLDGTPLEVEASAVPFRYADQDGGLVFVRDVTARKQAESELLRHQELLQSIIDNGTAVVFVKDTEGRYLLINQRYAELFHVSREAMIGRTDRDVFGSVVGNALRAADQEVLDGGVAREFEEVVPQDDGPHIYLSHKFPLFDSDGRTYAIGGVASDITEQVRAQLEVRTLNHTLERRVDERTRELQATEQQLRETLTLNQKILMTSDMGTAAYRQDGQCILVNPAMAELSGGTQEQLLEQSFRQVASWRQAGLLAAAERVLASGVREELETPMVTSFGRNVWVHARLARFYSEGEPHLLLMLHDITEERRAAEALAEREREFRSLAENVPDNIMRWDRDGRVLYANRSLAQTLGMAPEQLVGKTEQETFSGGRFSALDEAVRGVGATGISIDDFEQIVPAPDGTLEHHLIRLVAERDANDQVVGVLGVGRDMSAQKRTEEALRLAASVFHNSAEGVLVTDANATILSVNPAFSEITGYSEAEALGRRPSLLRSARHGPEFYQVMWEALKREGRWQGEIWNRRKGGEAYLEWLTINRIDDAAGAAVRYVAVFHDITELRRKDEHIRHLAFHDALTGLPNRSLMQDRLQHAIERALRKGGRLSLTFMDLDRFKAINDGLGHDVGDLLLQEVAARIKGRLRAADTVARLGGDEFVVLMEDLSGSRHCAAVAEQIIAEIARPMQLRGQTVEVGVSMGMAFYPEDGADALELMRHADMAMYAAKEAGRNTYRFFRPDMLARASERLTMQSELRRAIAGNQLELHYQPRVTMATGESLAVEALVRWRHPLRGLLAPMEFIPLREECGLIRELGDWVLDEACRQAALWQGAGRNIRVGVNVSARQLDEGGLVARIVALAAHHGIAPALLEIELTESAVMANPQHAAKLLARLRDIGVTVAVDDFGTGYSSLAYLRRLPIDMLKIDRSFVKDAESNDEDAQIVKTILALGEVLKLTVVAEGIETCAQAKLLQSVGCALAQGFLYSRPLPAQEIEAWLDTARPAQWCE